MRLELALPRLVAAVALLLGVILCRSGLDDLLHALARRVGTGGD